MTYLFFFTVQNDTECKGNLMAIARSIVIDDVSMLPVTGTPAKKFQRLADKVRMGTSINDIREVDMQPMSRQYHQTTNVFVDQRVETYVK